MPRNRFCCPQCALPLNRAEVICGVCLTRPPPYAQAWIPYQYAYPLDQLVTQFKFTRQLATGRVLGELLIDAAKITTPTRPELLIPMPLHRQRLRERGYNQALELIKPLAKQMQIEVDVRTLVRIKPTQAQSELDAKTRQRNVRDAFAVQRRRCLPEHIALFDDVVTTGATVREAALALRQAGVKRIDVWALARAPRSKM